MESRPSAQRILVVATTSRHKLDELVSLLRRSDLSGDLSSGEKHFGFEVRGIRDVIAEPPQVDEDGATFEANAMKKAAAAANATGLLALADDSGLEVDALDGRPGIRSARFAREGATDAENNAALLAALGALSHGGSHDGGYRARYRCVLVLVDPRSGSPVGQSGPDRWSVQGVCEGTIIRTPRGRGGFGYDPLFIPAGRDKTFAELDPEEKNRISHRARAAAALRPILRSLAE